VGFASVGTLLSQNEKASSSSWTTTIESAVAAGQLLVIAIATDNLDTSDGETSPVTQAKLTTGGQDYVFSLAKRFTNGQGSAAAGASIWLGTFKNAPAASIGDNVRIDFSGAITAKAVRGWKFTMDNSKLLTIENSTTRADDGTDMGPVTLSGLVNREHLFFRASAVEDTPASHTPTGGWTQIDSAADGGQTSGGVADTNIDAYGEFLIDTGTSATSDPDADGVSPDCASVMVAFYEETVVVGGSYPWGLRRRR
jgi:hypothetical protein